jgi:large conductance mechanosensitive channel
MEIPRIDPTNQAWSLVDEFKRFAFKGNVIDLAVGVIIGGAFGKIVDSLVKSLIMPLLSVVLPSRQRYQDWAWTLRGQQVPYGQFLAEVVNFLIVAAALFFFVVKFLGWLTRTRKEEATKPPVPTREEDLLAEIRDLLRAQAGASPGARP